MQLSWERGFITGSVAAFIVTILLAAAARGIRVKGAFAITSAVILLEAGAFYLLFHTGATTVYCQSGPGTHIRLEMPLRYVLWTVTTIQIEACLFRMVKMRSRGQRVGSLVSSVLCMAFGYGAGITRPYSPESIGMLLASFLISFYAIWIRWIMIKDVWAWPEDRGALRRATLFAVPVSTMTSMVILPCVWVFAYVGMIDPGVVAFSFAILEITSKGAMASLLSWSDLPQFMDRLRMRLIEAEATRVSSSAREAAMRSIMRYLFHELRVPLNSIVLGLEESQEVLGDVWYDLQKAGGAYGQDGHPMAYMVSSAMGTIVGSSEPADATSAVATVASDPLHSKGLTQPSQGPKSPAASVEPHAPVPIGVPGGARAGGHKPLSSMAYEPVPPNPSKHSGNTTTASDERTVTLRPSSGARGMPGAMTVDSTTAFRDVLSALAMCKSSALSLGHLLDDFLSLDKIERGQLQLEKTNVRVKRMVDESIRLFQPALESKGLRLTRTVHSPVPSSIVCDDHKLRQCLCNFISNAIKFTPEDGSIEVSISVVYAPAQEVDDSFHGPEDGHSHGQTEKDGSTHGEGRGSATLPAHPPSDSVAVPVPGARPSVTVPGPVRRTSSLPPGDGTPSVADTHSTGHMSPHSHISDPDHGLDHGMDGLEHGPRSWWRALVHGVWRAWTTWRNFIEEAEEQDSPHASSAAVTPAGAAMLSSEAEALLNPVMSNSPLPDLVPHLRIAVKDTGVGISAEDQLKLFQPFKQIRAGALQKGNGTGLGLAIVRQVVTLCGGYVGVSSSVGQGSTFWFAVPVTVAVTPLTALSTGPVSPPSTADPEHLMSSARGPVALPVSAPASPTVLSRGAVPPLLSKGDTGLDQPLGAHQTDGALKAKGSEGLILLPITGQDPQGGRTSGRTSVAGTTSDVDQSGGGAIPMARLPSNKKLRFVDEGGAGSPQSQAAAQSSRDPVEAGRSSRTDSSGAPQAVHDLATDLPGMASQVGGTPASPSQLPRGRSLEAGGSRPPSFVVGQGSNGQAASGQAPGSQRNSIVNALTGVVRKMSRTASMELQPSLVKPLQGGFTRHDSSNSQASDAPAPGQGSDQAGRLDSSAYTWLACAVVVDDVAGNRQFMARMLKRRGVVDVLEAADGQEAVNLADRLAAAGRLHDVQAWFLDEEMPVLKGHEAVEQLRARGVKALILSVTGNALDEDRTMLLASGADGVVNKPVRVEQLEGLLADAGLCWANKRNV